MVGNRDMGWGGRELPTSRNDCRRALASSTSSSYAAAKTNGQSLASWWPLVKQTSHCAGTGAFTHLAGRLLLLLLLLMLLLEGTLGVNALGVGILHDPPRPLAGTADFPLGACGGTSRKCSGAGGAGAPESNGPRGACGTGTGTTDAGAPESYGHAGSCGGTSGGGTSGECASAPNAQRKRSVNTWTPVVLKCFKGVFVFVWAWACSSYGTATNWEFSALHTLCNNSQKRPMLRPTSKQNGAVT